MLRKIDFYGLCPLIYGKAVPFRQAQPVVEAAPQASGVAATYFFNGNRKGESFRTSGGTAAILRNISN
jgi:hypothetical protein